MASILNTIDDVNEFYDQCISFWIRQGDPEEVACAKAFWWDIVEISNQFDSWSPAKEQFAADTVGYHPGDPEPSEEDVKTGRCNYPAWP